METEYITLDVEWDHQIIKYTSGKKAKLIRGVDYDPTWVNLGKGFAKKGKEITFYNDRQFAKLYHSIDFPTFELIESYQTSTNYFKDKNHVYIDSYMNRDFAILEDANPNDFKILDIKKGYATSQKIDFYYHSKLPFRLKDYHFFEGNVYQRVGNEIFWGLTTKIECDADTYELVDSREYHKTVFKDKNHIYHKGKIVENADPATFHFIENCIEETLRPRYANQDIHYYAKDDQFAFFVDSIDGIKVIKTKDLEGFDFKVVDGEGYAYDKDYTYHIGKRKKNEN